MPGTGAEGYAGSALRTTPVNMPPELVHGNFQLRRLAGQRRVEPFSRLRQNSRLPDDAMQPVGARRWTLVSNAAPLCGRLLPHGPGFDISSLEIGL